MKSAYRISKLQTPESLKYDIYNRNTHHQYEDIICMYVYIQHRKGCGGDRICRHKKGKVLLTMQNSSTIFPELYSNVYLSIFSDRSMAVQLLIDTTDVHIMYNCIV